MQKKKLTVSIAFGEKLKHTEMIGCTITGMHGETTAMPGGPGMGSNLGNCNANW